MDIKLNSVLITDRKPETMTQAYHAGIIVSIAETHFPKDFKVNLAQCMVNFHSLKEVFGERVWFKFRSHFRLRDRILVYEKFSYQPFMPRTMIGSSREFCLGYAQSHERTTTKRNLDRERVKHVNFIRAYLVGGETSQDT